MTTYNKNTLKTFFQTGDVPTGQNFSDFIDSYVNIVETGVQVMAGALSTTEIVAARVSAGTANLTGTLSIGGITSAVNLYSDNIISSAHTTGILTVTGDVSANNGTIYASANRWSNGIVSAAGTAQATGALLIYTINNGKGVVDGQTTGFRLPSNQPGRIQYIINDAVSANLWPPIGGQINALSSNAAFAMVASTPYTIIHTLASGYAVK